jgi:hypothetical protein
MDRLVTAMHGAYVAGGPYYPATHRGATWAFVVIAVMVGFVALIALIAIGLWIKYLIDNRR